MGRVDSRINSCIVECRTVELLRQYDHTMVAWIGTDMAVVQEGERPSHDTMLHTGTRSVWTVQAAKTPVRSGQGKNGCG